MTLAITYLGNLGFLYSITSLLASTLRLQLESRVQGVGFGAKGLWVLLRSDYH